MTVLLSTFWFPALVLAVVALGGFALGVVRANLAKSTDIRAAFERGRRSGIADTVGLVRHTLAQCPTSRGGRAIARAVGVYVPPLPRHRVPAPLAFTNRVVNVDSVVNVAHPITSTITHVDPSIPYTLTGGGGMGCAAASGATCKDT